MQALFHEISIKEKIMYTEKIIDEKGNISIPLKFKLHQKVIVQESF